MLLLQFHYRPKLIQYPYSSYELGFYFPFCFCGQDFLRVFVWRALPSLYLIEGISVRRTCSTASSLWIVPYTMTLICRVVFQPCKADKSVGRRILAHNRCLVARFNRRLVDECGPAHTATHCATKHCLVAWTYKKKLIVQVCTTFSPHCKQDKEHGRRPITSTLGLTPCLGLTIEIRFLSIY